MTRFQSNVAVLLTAIAGVVPQAHAQTTKVILSGASVMWQTMALAAYNSGKCVSGGTAPCSHYTAKNFNLNDGRPTVKGGSIATDLGNVWVVWDSSSPVNVWVYSKVDAAIGTRCFFAQPHCNITAPSSGIPAPANLISSTLWGDGSSDSALPSALASLFTGGNLLVNGSATDNRPEDDLFATCRANSSLGGGTDGLAGLGYNSANAPGNCPVYGATLAKLEGADIKGAYAADSTASGHLLAFAIGGRDPFTGTSVPSFSAVSVGAAPILFFTEQTAELKGLQNASDAQLQSVFGGTDCNASVFGLPSGSIDVYLREPTAGAMNTAEYTVFRYKNASGLSQEAGVAAQNPLNKVCTAGGGSRLRAIGSTDEVASVQNSAANNGHDGIGYTFFSFGNVSTIADNANYKYITLDGVDGLYHKYGTTLDPGQPHTAGELPSAADLPASCSGAFPCSESKIWSGGLSFPNLRNGSYRAWSTLRIISSGSALAATNLLVTGAQTYAVNSVPDFVPALKVGTTDPGLQLLRSHYTQQGVAPQNFASTGDKGGDAGGCILTIQDSTTKLAQIAPGSGCVVVP